MNGEILIMTIIGISGSPIANSNTDRALRIALDATGMETEFIKLSDYSYQPCRACLGCEETNICVLKDDATILAQKIRHADALIVAGYTPYSSLDGRTKSFLERLWQLRHQNGLMKRKPGGIIITSAMPPGNAMRSQTLDHAISSVQNYMMTEGMDIVGTVGIVGVVPCVRCTPGDHCKMSGIKKMIGPDAPRSSVNIPKLENQEETISTLVAMGMNISKRVENTRKK
jgi:multimeric flavodoxin WrbA